MVEDAIRPHVGGAFGVLLEAVVTHRRCCFIWIRRRRWGPNSTRGAKRGKGLNENLARELLELHTLGVGSGFTQGDVQQLAELLTGLTVVPDKGFAFDPGRAEPGAEVVLGVEYGGEGVAPVLAALRDLAVRPETARHIATKLAVHFVADAPDAGLVEAMAAAWAASGGDLAAVAAAMLGHPAAWAPEAAKARQPFDFVVAALRALGVTGDEVMAMAEGPFLRMILDPMADMGQRWNGAGGPDGWPEAVEDWITPQGMAARITWAMEVPGRLVTPCPRRQRLRRGPWAGGCRVGWTGQSRRRKSRREAVGLVLSSPEFNRR